MTYRKVFILLTRLPNFIPRAVGFLTRYYYNHTSIGLDEDMNVFYSFAYKGFIIERLTRYIRADREPFPCLLYEIEVPEETYQSIKEILHTFIENKVLLRYNKIGVALCLLRIPCRRRRHYFCSQFVAEVLSRGGAASLRKASALYLPRDFATLRGVNEKFRGDLRGMAQRYRLMPSAA